MIAIIGTIVAWLLWLNHVEDQYRTLGETAIWGTCSFVVMIFIFYWIVRLMVFVYRAIYL